MVDGRLLGEDRDALLALEVARVHDPVDDGLVRPEGAGLAEHRVDQRGLAVVDVGDDGDVAQVGADGGPGVGRRAAVGVGHGCGLLQVGWDARLSHGCGLPIGRRAPATLQAGGMTVAAVILSAPAEGALADTLGQPRVRRLADLAWSGGALPIVVVVARPGRRGRRRAGRLRGASTARRRPPRPDRSARWSAARSWRWPRSTTRPRSCSGRRG